MTASSTSDSVFSTPVRRSVGINPSITKAPYYTGLQSDASLLPNTSVPASFAQAISPTAIDVRIAAIHREHQSLQRNHTWKLVPRRPDMKIRPCMYIFMIKISGPKAPFVGLASRQVHGPDFEEALASLVKYTSIRVLMATVAIQKLLPPSNGSSYRLLTWVLGKSCIHVSARWSSQYHGTQFSLPSQGIPLQTETSCRYVAQQDRHIPCMPWLHDQLK